MRNGCRRTWSLSVFDLVLAHAMPTKATDGSLGLNVMPRTGTHVRSLVTLKHRSINDSHTRPFVTTTCGRFPVCQELKRGVSSTKLFLSELPDGPEVEHGYPANAKCEAEPRLTSPRTLPRPRSRSRTLPRACNPATLPTSPTMPNGAQR